ncbi:MAG: alpha-glucuronidase family glycosyl hydrolase [Bacteroidota bacterium]
MPSDHAQQSRCIVVVLSGLIVLWSSVYGSTGNSVQLVRNGHSAYRIALSGNASEIDKKAAGELQKYLNEISGVSLPIITAPDQADDSLIWIGSADHIQNLPTRLDWQKFEDDGFCIRTEGTSLIIAGGKAKGSLYGVYSFLEKYLGCRKFSPTVEVIPKRKTITLHPIDDTQVPVPFSNTGWNSSTSPDTVTGTSLICIPTIGGCSFIPSAHLFHPTSTSRTIRNILQNVPLEGSLMVSSV